MALQSPQADYYDHFDVTKLPDLIARRKKELQEETRRKVAADLERIRSSSSGDSERPALEILPKEIWAVILEYLKDPKDIESAHSTCTVFEELLEGKYFSLVLFPNVFSLETFQRILGKPALEETSTGIAKLRSVSKLWRDGVDAYLGEVVQKSRPAPLFSEDREERIRSYHLVPNISNSVDEGNLTLTDKILNEVIGEENERKVLKPKLFKRYVTVHGYYDTLGEHLDTFLFTKVTKVLEAVGNQILKFKVMLSLDDLRAHDVSSPQLYLLICKWADCMPQLRQIQIDFMDSSMPTSLEAVDLRERIAGNTFPVLPHLTEMGVNGSEQDEATICFLVAIMDSNPQIRDLKLQDIEDEEYNSLNHRIHSLNHVESGTISMTAKLSVADISSTIVNQAWPLKKLELGLVGGYCWVNLSDLFRFLENFQDLQHLDLILFPVEGGGDPGFLRLPNLTHFSCFFKVKDQVEEEINFINYSINYMLPMQKLESLVWRCGTRADWTRFDQENRPREIIQFRGGRMDLCLSNMWDIFPKLKTVVVEPEPDHRNRYGNVYLAHFGMKRGTTYVRGIDEVQLLDPPPEEEDEEGEFADDENSVWDNIFAEGGSDSEWEDLDDEGSSGPEEDLPDDENLDGLNSDWEDCSDEEDEEEEDDDDDWGDSDSSDEQEHSQGDGTSSSSEDSYENYYDSQCIGKAED